MGGVSTDAVTSMVIFYHQSPWMMPSTWSDGDTNRDDQDDCHELSSTHISFLCNQIFRGSERLWSLVEAFPLISERFGALGAEISALARVMKKHPNEDERTL